MPKLNMIINHHLPQAEALERVKGLLGDVKTEFVDKIDNLKESWKENQGTFSFDAMGISVSGTLTVTSNAVEIDGKIPWTVVPFKGRIESAIRERADELLI